VISGNLCLGGFLGRERLKQGLPGLPPGTRAFLEAVLEPWLAWYRRTYDLDGFHPWDAIAALYLSDPQLFESHRRVVVSDVEDLRSGWLRTADPDPAAPRRWVNLPTRLRDPEGVHEALFAAWARLDLPPGDVPTEGSGRPPAGNPKDRP
jgi:purine nucleosidase